MADVGLPRKLAGNPDSPQVGTFWTSRFDVILSNLDVLQYSYAI